MDYMENLKRPEILIVDDAPEQIQFISSVLKRGEYLVRAITNGKQVFEALKKGVPDLILLDIVMPEIDGFEVCKRLKKDENYSSIPVIFLTAMDDTVSIVKGFEMGALDFVSKPVNPDVLLARVETHIKLKRRTDKLLDAYKGIESFNHMVSHDLKAPLWDIQKLVKYMEQSLASHDMEETEELMEALNEKAEEAGILVDKLSQLTRTSCILLSIEAVDMNKLANQVYEELIANYSDREIEFQCSSLPIVFCDRLLLRQVLINILSNALKFTGDRKPAIININCHKTGMEYVFSIEDNGVGFDMKYSRKLFGMFQRLHSQQEFEGTGAGLAIVKNIINRHNGRVWIEAEQDKGAVFSFTLPLRVS